MKQYCKLHILSRGWYLRRKTHSKYDRYQSSRRNESNNPLGGHGEGPDVIGADPRTILVPGVVKFVACAPALRR